MTTRIVADLLSLDRSKVIGGALVALSVVLALLPSRLTAPARAWVQGPVVRVTAALRGGAHYLFTPPNDDLVDPDLREAFGRRDRVLRNAIVELRRKIDVLEGAARSPDLEGSAAQADIVMTRRARMAMSPAGLWGSGLLINRGGRAGVRPDDPALIEIAGVEQGIDHAEDLAGYVLLGKVWRVGPLSSELRLSTHEHFAASVKVIDAEGADVSYGMAHGTGVGTLSVRYLKIDHPVKVGQLVVTDGRDGLFPPGLVVGRAISVTNRTVDGFKDVEVAPAYDPQTVQWVLVVRRRAVPMVE